ncbi:MAG: DUF177 domain-containing protein [Rhizobiaceae bacterium]|nr:DUF177 domain-containing protein [Rhizobiaceae bacterium]
MADDQESYAMDYKFNVRKLSKKGQMIKYAATESERSAIARDYELLSVEAFEVECVVAPWKRDGVKLSGAVVASFEQPCAVTAEPLNQVVREDIDFIYLPEGSRLLRPPTIEDHELVLDPEGEDMPETFVGDSINLAAAWLETFALGIDPFARIDGAEFADEGLDRERDSPFSVLANLKTKPKLS